MHRLDDEVKPHRRSRRRPAASFLHSWQQLVVGSILVTGTPAYRTLNRLLRIKCSRKLASIYTLFALAAPWHPSGRQTCVVVTVRMISLQQVLSSSLGPSLVSLSFLDAHRNHVVFIERHSPQSFKLHDRGFSTHPTGTFRGQDEVSLPRVPTYTWTTALGKTRTGMNVPFLMA